MVDIKYLSALSLKLQQLLSCFQMWNCQTEKALDRKKVAHQSQSFKYMGRPVSA